MNTTQNPVCLYGGRNVTELQVITVIGPLIQRDKTALYCRTTKDSTKRQEEVPEHIEKLIEAVHPSVPKSIVMDLEELLTKYQDVFFASQNWISDEQT